MTRRPTVVVVGLGPGDVGLVTDNTKTAIERVPRRFVRTRRHPAATLISDAESFDGVYEAAATMDEVYDRIVDALVSAAQESAEVLYGVPGSPAVAERTVELLRADNRVDVDIVPAMSFADLAWVRLGVDPVALGVRLVDGHRFAVDAAGERGPLLVAQCDSVDVLSAIKLAVDRAPEEPVVFLQRLGLPDEAIVPADWADLDRSCQPDHLTALWIPTLAAPVGRELAEAGDVVRILRQQCPWDREQTHASLIPYVIEETYEVVEALQRLDADEDRAGAYAHVEEELGDLLYQVLFHATLGAEEGQFTIADVARGLHEKLVRRHPHVFGDVEVGGADDVVRNWEVLKRAEKGRTGVFDGVPGSLPALLYAAKLQKRAENAGTKVQEYIRGDVRVPESAEEVGEYLFRVVDASRRLEIDPEAALRGAAARFREHVETGGTP